MSPNTLFYLFFSNHSCRFGYITDSFVNSEDGDREDGEGEQAVVVKAAKPGIDEDELEVLAGETETTMANQSSCQVINGSVLLSPSKDFQSDSSESGSYGHITEGETVYSDDDADNFNAVRHVIL